MASSLPLLVLSKLEDLFRRCCNTQYGCSTDGGKSDEFDGQAFESGAPVYYDRCVHYPAIVLPFRDQRQFLLAIQNIRIHPQCVVRLFYVKTIVFAPIHPPSRLD